MPSKKPAIFIIIKFHGLDDRLPPGKTTGDQRGERNGT